MPKYFLLFFFFVVVCVLPSVAQENVTQERTLLLIPLEMKGSYSPVTSAELSDLLKAEIEKAAPTVKLVIAPNGVAMLDAKEATRLGREAGAQMVFFGDVRFRREAKPASLTGGPPEGYPGGSSMPSGYAMRYNVTLSGVAHGKLVDVASGEVLAEEPALLMASEMTGGTLDGPVMEKVEHRLADHCVRQISEGLVERLKAAAIRDGKL